MTPQALAMSSTTVTGENGLLSSLEVVCEREKKDRVRNCSQEIMLLC